MRILGVDTSTEAASLALWDGGQVIWERQIGGQRTHSASLFGALSEALKVMRPERIAVGVGPGSFAGIRISIAAVLGLRCVLECEVVGLPSALGLGEIGGSFRVVGDARRGSWYYTKVAGGWCVDGPRLLEGEEAVSEVLKAEVGPVFSTDVVLEKQGATWGVERRLPSAAVLAELAANGRGVVQTGDLEPLYLREAHITLPPGAAIPRGVAL